MSNSRSEFADLLVRIDQAISESLKVAGTKDDHDSLVRLMAVVADLQEAREIVERKLVGE